MFCHSDSNPNLDRSTLHCMHQGHSLRWPIVSLCSVHLTLAMRLCIFSLGSVLLAKLEQPPFGSLVPWLLLSAPSLPSPTPQNKLVSFSPASGSSKEYRTFPFFYFLRRQRDGVGRDKGNSHESPRLTKHGLQQRGLWGSIHATLTPPHPYFPKPLPTSTH